MGLKAELARVIERQNDEIDALKAELAEERKRSQHISGELSKSAKESKAGLEARWTLIAALKRLKENGLSTEFPEPQQGARE